MKRRLQRLIGVLLLLSMLLSFDISVFAIGDNPTESIETAEQTTDTQDELSNPFEQEEAPDVTEAEINDGESEEDAAENNIEGEINAEQGDEISADVMPDSEIPADGAVLAENIYVGSTKIAQSGVEYKIGGGTVVYDSEDSELELNGVSITDSYSTYGAIYSDIDLTLSLVGSNSITSGKSGFACGIEIAGSDSYVDIIGDGSLTISGVAVGINTDTYIYDAASLTVTTASDKISGSVYRYIGVDGDLFLYDAASSFTVSDASLQGNASGESVYISMFAVSGGVYLYGESVFEATVGKINTGAVNVAENFRAAAESVVNCDHVKVATVSRGSSAEYVETKYVINSLDLSDICYVKAQSGIVLPYGRFFVGGMPVTESNKDDILGDGTLSYIPSSKMLIMNGAVVTADSNNYLDGGIVVGFPLRIFLPEGTENSISGFCDGVKATSTEYIGGEAYTSLAEITVFGGGELTVNSCADNLCNSMQGVSGYLTVGGNTEVSVNMADLTVYDFAYSAAFVGSVNACDNAVVTASVGDVSVLESENFDPEKLSVWSNCCQIGAEGHVTVSGSARFEASVGASSNALVGKYSDFSTQSQVIVGTVSSRDYKNSDIDEVITVSYGSGKASASTPSDFVFLGYDSAYSLDNVKYISVSAHNTDYTFRLIGNGAQNLSASITGCRESVSGALTVPAKIGGYNVTSIASGAFNGSTQFSGKLTIPANVTQIGVGAFGSMKGITSVGIAAGNNYFTSDGKAIYTDGGKTLLVYVVETSALTIPDTVEVIGESALAGKSFSGELKIPASVGKISDNAFAGASFGGTRLTVPATVNEIGSGAFDGTGFGELYIYNNNVSFSGKAFASSGTSGINAVHVPICFSIPDVKAALVAAGISESAAFVADLPGHVDEDDDGICDYCHGKIEFRLNYQTSGKTAAIVGCEGKTESIVIPESIYGKTVIEIAENAFANKDFTALTLPDSLTEIGKNAFANTPVGGEITLGRNLTAIGDGAFSGTSITAVNYNSVDAVLGKNVFPSTVTEVTIPHYCTVDLNEIKIALIGAGIPSNAVFYEGEFEHVYGCACEESDTLRVFAASGVDADDNSKSVGAVEIKGSTLGGNKFMLGETVTLRANTAAGYSFDGWYDSKGVKVCDSLEYTFAFDKTDICLFYYAKYKSNAPITLTVAVSDGYEVYVGSSKVSNTADNTYSYQAGTKIMLSATGKKQFLYWQNESGKVLSRNRDLYLSLVTPTTVKPVYSDKAVVEFVSDSGQVIALQEYDMKGKTAQNFVLQTLPDGPAKMGYTFNKWQIVNGDTALDVTAANVYNAISSIKESQDTVRKVTATPSYTKIVINYTVTPFIDGIQGEKITAEAGSVVTVSAGKVENKKFACWSTDADGVSVLSNRENYSFQISSNVTLYAVYVDEQTEVEKLPHIAITNIVKAADDKLTFVVTRDVPDGYTVVEHGVLYNKDGTAASYTDDSFRLGGQNVSKSAAASLDPNNSSDYIEPCGVLNATVRASSASTKIVVRGYVVVRNNETGNEVTYYSDIAAKAPSELTA